MSTSTFRPKYVSFDCYGTLIELADDPHHAGAGRRPGPG